MATITYNIEDHVTNTTFVGVQFTVTLNAVAMDLTGAEIKMNVRRRDVTTAQNYEFSLGKGLSLITPASGIFTLDSQVVTIPAGKWKYDVTFFLASGEVHNCIKGDWDILENL